MFYVILQLPGCVTMRKSESFHQELFSFIYSTKERENMFELLIYSTDDLYLDMNSIWLSLEIRL